MTRRLTTSMIFIPAFCSSERSRLIATWLNATKNVLGSGYVNSDSLILKCCRYSTLRLSVIALRDGVFYNLDATLAFTKAPIYHDDISATSLSKS